MRERLRVSSEKEKSFRENFVFFAKFFFFANISLHFRISFAHEKCENFRLFAKFRFNVFREKIRKFREKYDNYG